MGNQYGCDWRPDADAILTRMWKDDHCAREIAEALGVTRNAVIGRAHRLHLKQHAGACVRRAPKQKPMSRLERMIAMKDGQCRWPIGEPKDDDFRFCGDQVAYADKPYCAHHCGNAYLPKGGKRP